MRLLNIQKSFSIVLTASALLAVGACTKKSDSTDVSTQASAPVDDAMTRGKKVYMANCIACHNVNPKQDGGIGPANWGSSRELLHDKVILNKYPEGYKPKRPSRAMAPLPHLEKDIDDLYSFLNN